MQANKMRIIAAIFFGILASNSPVLYAADATPAVPDPDISEDQTAEEMLAAEAALETRQAEASADPAIGAENPGDNGAPVTATSASGPADEDFVPTIQISEDLSVSFPVDI